MTYLFLSFIRRIFVVQDFFKKGPVWKNGFRPGLQYWFELEF